MLRLKRTSKRRFIGGPIHKNGIQNTLTSVFHGNGIQKKKTHKKKPHTKKKPPPVFHGNGIQNTLTQVFHRNGIQNTLISNFQSICLALLKIDSWKSRKHDRGRCHFDHACDAMYMFNMCSSYAHYVTSQHFLLFTGKDRTNMAAPWAQIRSKKSTSVAFRNKPYEACILKHSHIFYVFQADWLASLSARRRRGKRSMKTPTRQGSTVYKAIDWCNTFTFFFFFTFSPFSFCSF